MAATANRRIFCNWFTKKLQLSDMKSGEFVFPVFNKYETVPFEIVIVEPDLTGARIESYSRVDISNLSLSIAIHSGFDTATPLAYQTTFTKNEETNVFSGELALNTTAMNAYIAAQSSASAYLEIEIQEGTARSKIYLGQITLQNAVTQVSSTAPVPIDEYFTKSQTSAQFVQKVMPAGEQLTITSPGGTYQRIIGVDDGGAAIDIIIPV